ncbi:adenylyl-sulfate kinase [Dissulfurispira thermophila]|uniref:Adenylyl-sulfate kinase n=2 Tax=root TaxID=1 RepID=A0A7G1GYZ4_9BACT|nr:adenylyl-sulfate kinase [Dissulfurispira thermophila]BCB95209.1 adenylyl-sulfate kinase [Dissulfurispira thermophila]
MKGIVLWITGLPGSGKSTIADGIKDRFPDFVILRMDKLRKIVTPEPTYSEEEREIVYRCIVYMAKILSDLNHNVIIDATGNMRRWRELAREIIPNFAEIYLKCPLDICIKRETTRKKTRGAPKGIYKKGMAGWPIPGINVPYEEPLNPEITIQTDKTSVEEALSVIKSYIEKQG